MNSNETTTIFIMSYSFLIIAGSSRAGSAWGAGTGPVSEPAVEESTGTGLLLSAGPAHSGQPTSSIRGIILDADTRVPLIGVSIVIAGSDPMIGTISDARGRLPFLRSPGGSL